MARSILLSNILMFLSSLYYSPATLSLTHSPPLFLHLALFLSLSLFLTFCLSLSLSLSLPPSLSLSVSLSFSYFLSLSLSFPPSLSFSFCLSFSYFLSFSLSLSLPPSLSFSLSLSHVCVCISFNYEAAVCGGIPIIHSLHSDFLADRITKIRGIMNGTVRTYIYFFISLAPYMMFVLLDYLIF